MSNSIEKQTEINIDQVNLRREFLLLQSDLLGRNSKFFTQQYLKKEMNRSGAAISMALDNHPDLSLLRERIYKHFLYLRKRYSVEREQVSSAA